MIHPILRDAAGHRAPGAATAASFLEEAQRAIERPEAAVVSFDVFDTLLKRRAPTPVAFFETVAGHLARGGWLLPHVSPVQFRAQRVAAERRARERMAAARGHHEVRLSDIWRELAGVLAPGAEPEAAAEEEFAVERNHILGNVPVLDLMALAQRRGRRVALVSDTYFAADQVARMLRRAARGRDDIDPGAPRIFASCEHATGKAGGLFDVVLRELGADPAGVVHLGDNPGADIEPAARRGMRAVLLPNGTSEGWEILAAEERYHRPLGARPPSEAAALAEGEVTSLRNAALLHGASSGAFDHFAFGAFVLGPILDLYLRWVERVLDATGGGEARVCGLLREGGFLAGLVAERRPGARVAALGVSRLAMARAALAEVTAETLAAAVPTRHAIPFAAFAERIGLGLHDFPRSYWTQSLSALDGPLVEEVIGHVLADPALVARVAAEGAAFRERMRRHLAAVLGEEGAAAGRPPCLLLDLGWAGTIQDRLVRDFGLPAERLTGLYLAMNERGLARGLGGLRAAGFLFDGPESHRLAAPALRFVEILEQAATPPGGSVVDYDGRGAPVFAPDPIPVAQRRERDEVQRGIRTYLAHAAAGATTPGPDPETARAVAQAVFLRAALAPTGAERRLFAGWVHDDSFADGALDALTPEPHRRIAPYMTPAQIAGAGFLHTYWPYGALDADSAVLARQAASAQLLGDRFDLFARPVPLALEVALGGEHGWRLGTFEGVAVNAFNRFAVELEANALASDRLLLRFRTDGPRPPRAALEVACFTQPGGAEGERQMLALDAGGLRGLLRLGEDGAGPAPPDGSVEVDGAATLALRVPERVMSWRGRVRLVLGFHVQDRPGPAGFASAAPAREAAEPSARGWFDSLLGLATPLAPGAVALQDGAAVLASHGWVVDTAGWRGPDAVRLAFRGEAETLRFDADLVPRADIPRGFGRAIRGLAGCLCRVPLVDLPLGRYAVAWEARFGDRTARVEAPYRLGLEVDEMQRPRLLVEVTGGVQHA